MNRFRAYLGLCILLTIAYIASGCSIGDKNLADQVKPPEIGEEILVIETEYGVIKARMFNELAPQACQGVKRLVQAGFYKNKSIDRLEKDFLFQVNQKDQSEYQETPLVLESTKELKHYKGALGLARTRDSNVEGFDNLVHSFYIIAPSQIEDEYLSALKNLNDDTLTDLQLATYKEMGGVPRLDGEYTIFGQVFEGLEVLDRINDMVANASIDHSIWDEGILLKSIEIVQYDK